MLGDEEGLSLIEIHMIVGFIVFLHADAQIALVQDFEMLHIGIDHVLVDFPDLLPQRKEVLVVVILQDF